MLRSNVFTASSFSERPCSSLPSLSVVPPLSFQQEAYFNKKEKTPFHHSSIIIIMTTTPSIYRIWKDAVPVLPFPFEHRDKHEGHIVHTWADVKDGLNRDAINTALAFSTGHFTPTSPQSEIMRETMMKEQKRIRKSMNSRPSTENTETSSKEGEKSRISRVRGQVASAQERDALYNGEGGGRGRVAYLKMRRARSVQERFGERPQTTSHMYGWDCNPISLKRIGNERDSDNRKKGIGSWMRSRGVFSTPEFVEL